MRSPEFDDRELRRRFAAELAELTDAGEARPPHELLAGADSSRTDVRGPASGTTTLSPEAIYTRACRGVVAIGKLHDCKSCGGRHVSVASGFAVGDGTHVVTARHVLDDDEKLALGVMAIDGTVLAARGVAAASAPDDLALIRVDGGLEPLPVGREPEVGASVWVVSHPAGRHWLFSAGMVSRYSRSGPARGHDDEDEPERSAEDDARVRVMTITAPFARGSSGGPVLDATGAVVGVALRTNSIHHHGDGKGRPRLQMVLDHCASADALARLGLG